MRIATIECDYSLGRPTWPEQTTSRHLVLDEIARRFQRIGRCCIISAKIINSTSMFTRQAVRNFMTSAFRRGGHHDPYDGVPGYNFPFSTQNRHKLLLYFMLFLGSGFSIPLLIVRHQLKK